MRVRVAAVVLLVAVLASPVMGQEKQILLGIKGGVNLANVNIDPDPGIETTQRMGLIGGIALGFQVSPGMSLDTDLLYVEKGYGWDLASGLEDASIEQESKLTYLVVAPMLRFRLQGEGLVPYFLGGAEIGFLLDAENSGTITYGDGTEEDFTQDIKDSFKETDFGITFGAGLELPTGGSTIFFEGRYTLGLADIGADEAEAAAKDVGVEEDPKTTHRGVYIFAGLRF